MSKKKFQSQKSKKTKVALVEEVYKVFHKNPTRIFNYKQISSELGISDEGTRIMVSAILNELTDRKMLKETERGKFKLLTGENYVNGYVDTSSGGLVFVETDDGEQDIFISPSKTKNALKGDHVRVYVYPGRKGKKREGEIKEIIQRAKTDFVGMFQNNKKFAFVVPDNSRIPFDIFVPLDKSKNANDGDKVVVRITDWGEENKRNPGGEIIEILGKPGENETEMHAILAEYGLPIRFPENVENFAEKIPDQIPQSEIDKRRDFRTITTFTIDPADAKDFDDALSIRILPSGNYEIGVHIADVSHYIKPGSVIDKEAVHRATSVYLVDRCVPMLPEKLSNGVCSLRPNEEKLCFSAVFEMNENAELVTEWFGRTVIYSDRRFTYEEAQKVIETGQGDFAEEILIFDKLAKTLRKKRFSNGAINFNSIEIKFNLDEKGKPIGTYVKESKDSNFLIEEFMLLANRRVAEFIGKTDYKKNEHHPEWLNKKPKTNSVFVYRIHDKPSEEKLGTFVEFVKKLGYQFKGGNEKNVADSMNKLMTDIKGKGEENMLEQLAIRTMAKAIYTTENIGHYGLAFKYYTHFTSPIRRYPDVMVHRLLQYYLDGGETVKKEEYEDLCKHSSEMEKLAADAERSSVKYKQVEFLKDRIGMEFEGTISGVTEWGIYVEITENKCEGMVKIKDLPGNDFYVYDEDNYTIYGKRSGRKFRLGDKVRIEIKKADLFKKQLDFLLVEETHL